MFTNGTVTIGDLRVRADRVVFTQKTRHIEATGHVVLTRGAESLRGSRFVLDGDDAEFTATDATLYTPSLFIEADRIQRTGDTTQADNARLVPGIVPDGRGELQFHAPESQLTPDETLHLKNVAVFLYGVRLLTLRKLTVHLRSQRSEPERNGSAGLPVILRHSSISGLVYGLNQPFTLQRNLKGRAEVDETTSQGIEALVTLRDTLYSRSGASVRSALNFHPRTQAVDSTLPNPTPLRQLTTALPPAPQPDPLLDYTSIFPAGSDPLAPPTRSAGTNVNLDLNVWYNREVGGQRQGSLLVSREPELMLSGQVPIVGVPIPDDPAAARAALRRLRLALTGDGGAGSYAETRLFSTRSIVREDRLASSVGITTLPILIGQRLLGEVQTGLQDFVYSNGNAYHYLQTQVSGEYVFGYRTAFGLAFISRSQAGETPFDFDQVDTQDEGQVRGETAFGPHRKYTFAVLGRYDVSQRRFFDSQFVLSIRGHNVEPRFSYEYLNRQYSINFALPGINSL